MERKKREREKESVCVRDKMLDSADNESCFLMGHNTIPQ